MEDIIRKFSEVIEVDIDVLKGPSLCKDVCVMRYMIYAYLYWEKKISAPKIGGYFGRSRVNVLRGIRLLRGWMRYYTDIRDKYKHIKQALGEDN